MVYNIRSSHFCHNKRWLQRSRSSWRSHPRWRSHPNLRYGFSYSALELVHSYLSDRWHRTKINGSYSMWVQILCGMPQGSVNGPKWFNIYLNDFFFLFLDTSTDVCNIADDSTPYACNADLATLLHNLESDVASAILWFDANYMLLNYGN